MTKLNAEQCDEIRSLQAGGERQLALAARFGVSQAMVSKVVAGWSPVEAVEKVKPLCSFVDPVEGSCSGLMRANGYCTKHNQRFKAHGDPSVVKTTAKSGPLPRCSFEGCLEDARNYTSPWCETHYARVHRHGDPSVVLKDHTPAVERWKTSYVVLPTGCWDWTGPFTREYGFIQEGAAKRHMAHRFVWEQVVGPIAKGHVVDHHSAYGCHNKRCVNPAHLECVPQAINALRGEVNANKIECNWGHAFTESNTYIHPVTGHRQCRACRRALLRKNKYRYAYVYLYRPDHPIADKTGKVAEHRFVLFNAIGMGPHPCQWGCGRNVNWGGKSGINVDHLNGDPSDNRLENLVVSCQSCNKARAKAGNPLDWAPAVGGHLLVGGCP